MESHHILPIGEFPKYKSFKQFPWNKINLTSRQHFIAHMILWKCYGNTQTHAFYAMVCWKGIKINSKLYENNRNSYIQRQSLLNLGREPGNKGKPSKAKGTKFYNNGIVQIQVLPGSEPEGFIIGRLNKSWNSGLTKSDERVKRISKLAGQTRKSKNIKPWNLGLTKETNESLSNSSIKLKEVNTGKIQSEETKDKRKESLKLYFEKNPDCRKGRIPWNKKS
jgi:hypothetical protein